VSNDVHNKYVEQPRAKYLDNETAPDLTERALTRLKNTKKVVRDLKGVLREGEKITETLSKNGDLPVDVRKNLAKVSEYMRKAADELGRGADVIEKTVLAAELLQALQKWNNAEPGSEEFAKAAGEVFAKFGELFADYTGPAGYYFKLLAKMEGFFVSMRVRMVPQVRWKRTWDEIEKELQSFAESAQSSRQPRRKPSQPVSDDQIEDTVDVILRKLYDADVGGVKRVIFTLDRTDKGLVLGFRLGAEDEGKYTPAAWQARESVQTVVNFVVKTPFIGRYLIVAFRKELLPHPNNESGWAFDVIEADTNQIDTLIRNKKREAGYD